ncbi:MAG: putative toxin-antitoxin system toxin component, PIN family [Lewinellaceae bacterium]|nr:putative toxin-antitoxin system toxin component, PIN family [Lewinellaceae bacterium]
MKTSKSIVVIDSNIWLSFLIGKTISKLKERIAEGKIEIIITDLLIEEIKEVSPRKRFEKYFDDSDVRKFLKYLKSISIKIKIESEVYICRDDKDNYLLALAQDCKADYIVTGDKDLLTLEKFGETQIIRFNEFNELFQP